VRFLPSTVVLIVIAPIAGRLVDRVGPRLPITAGLTAVAASLYWQSGITTSTGYERLLPAFILMGLGMGFVMSPMSAAAMNAVAQTKAGVASGILSMNRMVGGTFGVAVLGALVTALGRSKLGDLVPSLPAGQRQTLAQSLGAGGSGGHTSAQVAAALRDSFIYALSHGLRLAAAVAAVGAFAAWLLITPHPQPVSAEEALAPTAAGDRAAAELESAAA
jgi:MFS family permease